MPPAEVAGLKITDTIQAINGIEITDFHMNKVSTKVNLNFIKDIR